MNLRAPSQHLIAWKIFPKNLSMYLCDTVCLLRNSVQRSEASLTFSGAICIDMAKVSKSTPIQVSVVPGGEHLSWAATSPSLAMMSRMYW